MKKFILSALISFLFITPVWSVIKEPVTPENALQSYLNNGDKSFQWQIREKVKGEGITFFQVQFTSQIWQGIEWKHDMMIMVPDELKFNKALLFITGGSNSNEEPNSHKVSEELPQEFGKIAKTNKAIVALLWQVPNQPLFDNLVEDALISKTLHNYLSDHDFTWPLLFPMTKSAVRAMDIVQKFSKKELHTKIDGFVVSGASKRGWTTWLTGANDPRVIAIAPMVIDMLNMSVNIDYQKKVWGDYSEEISDYVKLGIAQQFGNKQGGDLVIMIDPYSYRKKLTMPKMIFIGTNDKYWPVDAVKNYIDSIPGDNHICYIANAGHDMGDQTQAISTLSAFLGTTVTNTRYPVCDYSVKEDNGIATLTVNTTSDILIDAFIWTAISNDRDFRDEQWSSISLNAENKQVIEAEVNLPESGFKAFYIDLKYKAPFGGDYIQSTRMFVTDSKQLLLTTK